jgi:hypothetical protein
MVQPMVSVCSSDGLEEVDAGSEAVLFTFGDHKPIEAEKDLLFVSSLPR